MERLVIQVYLDTVKEFLHKFAKGFLKKYRLAVLPQGKVKYCKLLNLSVHLSAVTRCVFWAKLNNRIFGDYSLNWQWQPWQDHKSYITALDVEFYIQQYERDIFELVIQVFPCLGNILLWIVKSYLKTLCAIVKMKCVQKNFGNSGLPKRRSLQPHKFQLPSW